MTSQIFRIGTRNSPLAMVQANLLREALLRAYADLQVELVPILSSADWKKSEGEKPLSEENGGKGLFAKEIEQAILDGSIDCGVHSLKDMASFLPEGLVINHVLPRANPCDAFISAKYKSISEMPDGGILGTCSVRRQAAALAQKPYLNIVPFRGNVQTRIDKIKSGQVEATFLAMAGIERLGIKDDIIHPISPMDMLPACGQGIVCMEMREDDSVTAKILDVVNCPQTLFAAQAEREVLRALDGSCHTPIAAYAVIENAQMWLRANVFSLDGTQVFEEEITAPCATGSQALQIGQEIGRRLKDSVPTGILT